MPRRHGHDLGEHVAPKSLRRLREPDLVARHRRGHDAPVAIDALDRVTRRHRRHRPRRARPTAASTRSITSRLDERARGVVDEHAIDVGRQLGDAVADGILAALAARREEARARCVSPTSDGPSATSSAGSTTTSTSMPGWRSKASTLRRSMVRSPMRCSCFGDSPPNRVPRPAATMMAPTDIATILSAELRGAGLGERDPSRSRGGDHGLRGSAAPARAKITTSARVVAGVTMVRAESERRDCRMAPSSSASVSRPPTCTVSLRMPAYASPGRPRRSSMRAVHVLEIVEPEWQLRLHRAPVDDVDEAVDPRQLVAAPHATEQRFGRRPRLGRIETDALVHRPDGGGDLGRFRRVPQGAPPPP